MIRVCSCLLLENLLKSVGVAFMPALSATFRTTSLTSRGFSGIRGKENKSVSILFERKRHFFSLFVISFTNNHCPRILNMDILQISSAANLNSTKARITRRSVLFSHESISLSTSHLVIIVPQRSAWHASETNIHPDSSASSPLSHRQVFFQCTQKEAARSQQRARGDD